MHVYTCLYMCVRERERARARVSECRSPSLQSVTVLDGRMDLLGPGCGLLTIKEQPDCAMRGVRWEGVVFEHLV